MELTEKPVVRRRTQERSRLTRQRLLEATISCLTELGWHGTTVAVVAERAGVSRGAAQHHFRTREELVTAAVDHVYTVRTAELRERAGYLPAGRARSRQVVELIGQLCTSPLFTAALHLWVAASSDAQLRAQVIELESRMGRETHRLAVELLGVDESRPGVRETVQASLDLARGLGLANLLTDDSARRKRLLRQWARILESTLD